MNQALSHSENTLSRSYANYLAQINMELTHASNKTNRLAQKIGNLASILLPLNLVTGLWGMNVRVPGRDVEGLGWFAAIITCMFIFSAATLLGLRRMKAL